MTDANQAFEHKDFRITVERDADGFVARVTRPEGRPVGAGRGIGQSVIYHDQDSEGALAAARAAIDSGEVWKV